MRRVVIAAAAAIGATVLAAGCSSSSSSSSSTPAGSSGSSGAAAAVTVRLGYLANITHAPALIAVKNGYFAKALGSAGTLKTSVFTSGTQETTAILAGQLDAAYVGPNPAINAWQKSTGTAIKAISGDLRPVRRPRPLHSQRGPAQGPDDRRPVAGHHPGRVRALLAQADAPGHQRDRRR